MALAQKVVGSGLSSTAAVALVTGPAPYTTTAYSQPPVNTMAIVTFPATPGKTWVIAAISGSLLATPKAAGYTNDWVSVRIPGIVWQRSLLCRYDLTNGGSDGFDLSGLAIPGALGGAVTVQFNANAGDNSYEIVSAGAYLV